jgi:elongation factor G
VGVLYREDLNKAITVEQQIKRQTGLNLYAYVQIEMGPGAAKGGLDFRTSLSSKALEASTFDAIQDGFSSAMQIRNRTGFPIHSLAADLIDMREHAVDSRPVAFQLVARMALETACDQAGTQLLEPIMRLEITALNAHHQEILQDLATCRATVQNIAQYENHMHLFVDIPLADLDGFLSRFGAADQKDRDFAVSFSHYAPVPKEEAPKVKASRAL